MLEASIEALGDDRLDTQARAALASLGPAALPALVARLGDVGAPPASRAEVVDLVASMALEQDPGRVPWAELLAALRGAAADVDRRLATRALAALARVGTIDDLELLARASLSADRALAWAGEAALSRLVARVPGAARTFFDRLVGDEAWTLPLAALLGALSAMGKARPDDMGFLAHAATSGGPAARRAAVAAAAQIGGAVALEVLSFALADEEPDVQLAAARGLGHLSAIAPSLGVDAANAGAFVAEGAPPREEARDTIPDMPASAGLAARILELVERSGSPDLVAAAVRAIGDGLASRADVPADDLLFALASFARHAPSVVALASVEALAHAPDVVSTARALAAGLEHVDDAVSSAAVLQLAARDDGWEAAVQALGHASPAVRRLAAEALAPRDVPRVRVELGRRLTVETNPDVRATLEDALGSHGRSSPPSGIPSRREGR